jgi:hypothetical protein
VAVSKTVIGPVHPVNLGQPMFRTLSLILVVLAVVTSSPAQVTVTNQGFATTPGPAVPATPVSPPILYAPVVRLDQGPTQPMEASASSTGGESQSVAVQPVQQGAAHPQPFNFGVAQFDTLAMQGGVGQPVDGKSLGDFAREQRQRSNVHNARTYTNTDIQNLRQPASTTEDQGAGSKGAGNWVPNNGVIDPNGVPAETPASNSVAAPTQNQSPAENSTPFGPKSPSMTPKPKPRAYLEGTNEVHLARLRQAGTEEQLPQTASKLPLIGVLGFFSVSMGIFVRYQRAKTK